MSEHNPIRYTVVYEGDPAGARILNGEPAPGRAVGVMLGDLFEKYDAEDKKADALIAAAESRAASAEAEVERLKARLEIDHAYDGTGNQIPFPAGIEHLDGIACRDETIRQQDEQIAKFRDRVAVLESAIKNFLDGNYQHPRPYRPGKCPHGTWYYEECGSCNDEYFTNALNGGSDV